VWAQLVRRINLDPLYLTKKWRWIIRPGIYNKLELEVPNHSLLIDSVLKNRSRLQVQISG